MKVTVDPDAGFCFGVENAIAVAESELATGRKLYCLEDIVHNSTELHRLMELGLQMISHADIPGYAGERVLVRAHGEPPETFRIAEENKIIVIDATCPIVTKLQERIGKCYAEESGKNIQIVLFGKKGHAEITGLMGHAGNKAIVVSGDEDLGSLDFSRPVRLYSQTTMDIDAYEEIAEKIKDRMQELLNDDLVVNNSYCRQVSRRSHTLREFAASHDVVIFVSDKKSSNGTFLFNVCKAVNEKCYFINDPTDIEPAWFAGTSFVGITGATSTPSWLMQRVADAIDGL
jgi:4-hydroxy-3-methylbut-2-en-1-yl diphosphate reductase